jgi:hypothetical protein
MKPRSVSVFRKSDRRVVIRVSLELAETAARRPDHQMKMPPESGGIERLVATERSRPMGTA